VLLIASWLSRPFVESGSEIADALWGLAGVGAILIVLLVIVWPSLRRACERPSALWLGRVSFSLYLVHAPVLGTLGYLLGREHWWVACLIGVPISLAVAAAFYRWVEKPSHRLARRVGGYVAQHLEARAA